jgi:hypothetical protein
MPAKNLKFGFIKAFYLIAIFILNACSESDQVLNANERQDESRTFVRLNQINRLLIAFQKDSTAQFLPKSTVVRNNDTTFPGKTWTHLSFINNDYCADGIIRTGNLNVVTHRNINNIIDSIWAYSTFSDNFGVNFGGRISRFQGNFLLNLVSSDKWIMYGDLMEMNNSQDLVRSFEYSLNANRETKDQLHLTGIFKRKYGFKYDVSDIEIPFWNYNVPVHGLLKKDEVIIDFDPVNNRAQDRFMKLSIKNQEFPFDF